MGNKPRVATLAERQAMIATQIYFEEIAKGPIVAGSLADLNIRKAGGAALKLVVATNRLERISEAQSRAVESWWFDKLANEARAVVDELPDQLAG